MMIDSDSLIGEVNECWERYSELKAEKAALVKALRKLEATATVLSNHDRIKQPTRGAGDWSRLHNAIDDARAVLASAGES